MRLWMGLAGPESGSISVFGRPPSTAAAAKTGYMPQLSALYLELSVQQNLGFFASMYGLSDSSQ
jgi:ABC-2 type transport system ATP-binding protein